MSRIDPHSYFDDAQPPTRSWSQGATPTGDAE